MDGIVFWLLVFILADGSRSAGGFDTVTECQAAQEQVSKIQDVAAVSECIEIKMRSVQKEPQKN